MALIIENMKSLLIFFIIVVKAKIIICQSEDIKYPIGYQSESELKCNNTELKKASDNYEKCKNESTRLYNEAKNKQLEVKRISEIQKNPIKSDE